MLNKVKSRFTTGKKRFLLFLIAEIFFCFYGYSQQLVNSNFLQFPRSIIFINEFTGYVVGKDIDHKGKIIKTTDGGKGWLELLNNNNTYLMDLCSLGDNIYITAGTSGAILKTTDGGTIWSNISYPTNLHFTKSAFVNNTTGYVVGGGFFEPIFLKTINGGTNWINIYIDSSYSDLYGIDFLNVNFGFAVGNRIILKTTNGGDSFIKIMNDNYYLFSVEIVDSNIAYASGFLNSWGPLIIKTVDSGRIWKINHYNNWGGFLNKIKFINSNFGIAIGDGGIVLKTVNGGNNWDMQILAEYASFYDVYFLNSRTGWIVGRANPNGLLYKTTNAGESWIFQNTLPNTPEGFTLLQNYPNPFNPKTRIKFKLDNSSDVILEVYDIIGKKVKTLLNNKMDMGVYEIEFDGSNLSSGVYFYKIYVNTLTTVITLYSEAKKMILLK